MTTGTVLTPATVGRTPYRPGSTDPATRPPAASYQYLSDQSGRTHVWTMTLLSVYTDYSATVHVTRTTPQPLGAPPVDLLDARITAHGITLVPSAANTPGIIKALQPALHDPQVVAHHLHTTAERVSSNPTPRGGDAQRQWVAKLRLHAEVFTLTDIALRSAAYNAVDAGYTGTFEDLLTVLGAATAPALTSPTA